MKLLKYSFFVVGVYVAVFFIAFLLSYKSIEKPRQEIVETNNKPTHIVFEKDTIMVSICLKDLIEDYIVEANKYDIDLSELRETEFIAHTDIYRFHKRMAYGITYTNRDKSTNHIMVDASVSHATQTFVKVVLYHELFHLLSGKGHVTERSHPYILRNGGDINVEYAIKNFDKSEVEEYFRFLKKVQTNNIKI